MTREQMDDVLDWIAQDTAAKRAAGRRLTEDDCAMYDAMLREPREWRERAAYPERVHTYPEAVRG